MMAAAWDGAPTRAEKRQQIRRALLVPETLPALEAEPYGQVEIASSRTCRNAPRRSTGAACWNLDSRRGAGIGLTS
jgi:hypothetical protein